MKSRLKKVIIATGALLCLTVVPISQANLLGAYMSSMTITAQAAEQNQLPYSQYWETQADGSWKYKLNSGGYATGWVQDEADKNWYYMDNSATMQSGVFKSYGKYYLLSELHDGHYGHLVKNGETYNGVFISADTSSEYEGALTDSTLSALRNEGVNVDNVKDISGSKHVSDGAVTNSNPSGAGAWGLTEEDMDRLGITEEDLQELVDMMGDGCNYGSLH